MKEITAYIQPFMLQKVSNALHAIHVRGMSITDIRGCGREKDTGAPEHQPWSDAVDYTKKIKLEVICHDHEVEQIVTTILENAHTGNRGDGKIFVSNVEQAIRIRTKTKGDEAI